MLNLVLKPPKIDPLVLDYSMDDRRLTAESLWQDWLNNQPLLAIEPTLLPEDSLLEEEETPEWTGESQIESIDENSSNLFFALDRKDLLKLICSFSRFGRRKTLVAYLVLAGVTVVAVSLIPNGTNNTGIWDPRIYFILISVSISREYSPTI